MCSKPAPFLALWLIVATPLPAQDLSPDPITLTLDEAIQIALLNGYAMESARLDLADADAKVQEGLGSVLPNMTLRSGYTRNLATANPFAGSNAGTLFASFGYVGWLAYNEEARTDDDPSTQALTLEDYQDRISDGMKKAGVSIDASDNPFAVANQFQNTITVSQAVVDMAKFRKVSGLKHLTNALEKALNRQQQLVVNQVRQAFFQTLLFQEQSLVATKSVERTRRTTQEAARLVARGIAPKVRRLSAEVQLANLETQRVQTQNQARTALDNLKFLLSIPVEQPVRLHGQLEADTATPYLTVSESSAIERAVAMRPDLQQLESLRDLAKVNLQTGTYQRLPSLNAQANFNYIGTVPSNRTFGRPDDQDPFLFIRESNSFFSSAFWQPAVSVGFNLQWSLFEGFGRRAHLQQLRIELNRTELEVLQARRHIRLEVVSALRNLQSAQSQIASQEQNVANAELNYTYAKARLSEGVGTPLEEREASTQLDQSRINHLQAVYNFLLAQSRFETAAGIPLASQSDFRLTKNRVR